MDKAARDMKFLEYFTSFYEWFVQLYNYLTLLEFTFVHFQLFF